MANEMIVFDAQDLFKFGILVIYKDKDDFVWKRTTEISYLSPCHIKDSDKIHCRGCKCALRDMKPDEEWYCWAVKNYYTCPSCFTKVKHIIVEYHEKEADLKRKIPTRINDVINGIRDHRNYESLDTKIKQDFEGILAIQSFEKARRRPDNNKDLRSIWFHLYHGKEYKPVGSV